MTEAVLVPVKRADIPEALMKWVKLDAGAGKIKSTWTEVVGWDSCKLMVRKQGAVTRYARSHYGYYACCRKAVVELAGYATEGTSYTELPQWALAIWVKAKAKAKESISEGYRVAQTRIRLDSWARSSMYLIAVYFTELETGTQWKVSMSRGGKRVRFVSHQLATDREWCPSIHGDQIAPAA